ncbi:YidH family protein [Reinekea marinisedimentorum]|uniref:Putative membrane protein n=1 Tax=Reinekea marinisedimentorum TaxID=230495 RepID=A0A4R3I1Z3_9GAMM|nr:DUF202 domain-containing protein [Reinekea marinisedimentorum]TCS38751.1 putative membrane protein [Reinekea marinisedimentorum]
MTQKIKKTKINWRLKGEAPDYRFSLANERTYLAWIRTALALLAGAIAIDQLTPDLANVVIRGLLSAFLCACSGLLAVFAYKRWAANEESMRKKEDLKYTSFLKVISIMVLAFTFILALVILL